MQDLRLYLARRVEAYGLEATGAGHLQVFSIYAYLLIVVCALVLRLSFQATLGQYLDSAGGGRDVWGVWGLVSLGRTL